MPVFEFVCGCKTILNVPAIMCRYYVLIVFGLHFEDFQEKEDYTVTISSHNQAQQTIETRIME